MSAFTLRALPPQRPECLYAGSIPVTSFALARSFESKGLVQCLSSAPLASDMGARVTAASILVAGSIITSHSAPSPSAHRAMDRIVPTNSLALPEPQISGGPPPSVKPEARRSSPHSPPSPEMDDVAPFTAVPAPRGGDPPRDPAGEFRRPSSAPPPVGFPAASQRAGAALPLLPAFPNLRDAHVIPAQHGVVVPGGTDK